eukprot:s2726_g10.t1
MCLQFGQRIYVACFENSLTADSKWHPEQTAAGVNRCQVDMAKIQDVPWFAVLPYPYHLCRMLSSFGSGSRRGFAASEYLKYRTEDCCGAAKDRADFIFRVIQSVAETKLSAAAAERSYVVAALERILVDYDHGLDKAWQMLVDWA